MGSTRTSKARIRSFGHPSIFIGLLFLHKMNHFICPFISLKIELGTVKGYAWLLRQWRVEHSRCKYKKGFVALLSNRAFLHYTVCSSSRQECSGNHQFFVVVPPENTHRCKRVLRYGDKRANYGGDFRKN